MVEVTLHGDKFPVHEFDQCAYLGTNCALQSSTLDCSDYVALVAIVLEYPALGCD